MTNRLILGALGGFTDLLTPSKTHFGPELRRWNDRGQVPHSHQIVNGAREGKDPVHFADSAMAQFAQKRDCLQPPEALFNPLPFLLTNTIPPCRVVRPSIALPPFRPKFWATCGVTPR
jgi:hypothetical protein